MTTTLCFLAWVLALLLVPAAIIGWALETRPERVRRLAASGWSQRRIADHLGISRHRVRLALA